MSMPCEVCQDYHGHNQEEHNRIYEARLHRLDERIAAVETHSCCNKRLKEEGGHARCCYCVPHQDCELNQEQP